ncbi:hypothetical protein [Caulobacter sp. FWC2]|uniref:hypothetical protein n=1 Tax=Caulobacter sp. FWC2 TaxID=69664 RepID=UPI000C155ADA|nr:hypothetical protein [Caulobacter sp. FWC2]PIB92774.1 hypothetical protein CSW62_15080 [Caulobacter sp. FWC2]
MTQHRHSFLVGLGFSLAYVAAMTAMLVVEMGRLNALAHDLLLMACLPAFVVGAALVLVVKLVPVQDDGSAVVTPR